MSANSSGRFEENNTSRDVPNSITVFSLKPFPGFSRRVNRTGIRTGVASGKNLASFEMELSRPERAVAVAALATSPQFQEGSISKG
jgi:hypothetical protein